MRYIPTAVAGFIGLVLLSVILGSWYTIDEGERGVVLRYGAVAGVAQPGLGFKIPLIDSIVRVSVQSKAAIYNQMEAYSRDQQPATMNLSVNYRIPPDRVEEVYANYGGEDGLLSRLVERRVFEESKTVFGKFNAVTAIQERSRLNQEIAEAIQSSVRGPVVVDSIQIENIDFSDAYEQAVEARMTAQVEVQKQEQNLQQEKIKADIAVTQAKGRADSVKAEADASAYKTKIEGEATAEAIKARAAALANNPLLVELTKAEKWNGELPTSMIPGSTVPFLDIGTPAATASH